MDERCITTTDKRGITRRGFTAGWIGAGIILLEAQEAPAVYPGADEKTPSRAEYFSWINNAWEGSTEPQTLADLDFFRWLRDEYGMQLDIYALDSGNLDGSRIYDGGYGSMDSPRFREKFPNGFSPIVRAAANFGCRMGIWLGPDGFGDTPEQERARTELLVGLCRDLHFALFKIDGAGGTLRPSKQDAYVRMITECRKYVPELILLNHRLNLGKALPYATTFLWNSQETYIDVWTWNTTTAPHHRAGALSRGLVPGLKRLAEDHGVCLSSCLDFWEDDLILQAFSRCLILAPEIYGNPWLLRDDEFPKLARIHNVHRRYRDILVNGMELPEPRYGPFAVSRGDARTRFLTLRNLTWTPVKYKVVLDASIGLADGGAVEFRRLHPSEKILDKHPYGAEVEVEVLPFRACLLMASAAAVPEVAVNGCDYEVVRDTAGKPAIVKLLGMPGTSASISLAPGERKFRSATIDGRPAGALVNGGVVKIEFPGAALRQPWHRKLGDLVRCEAPPDAEALYEATCFAADNNALEVRSLVRSGPTRIPEVERARRLFFDGPDFLNKGIWDRNLFDGREDTVFRARKAGGLLRIDFSEPIVLERLTVRTRVEDRQAPVIVTRVEGSSNLASWTPLEFRLEDGVIALDLAGKGKLRYVRIDPAPRTTVAVEAAMTGGPPDRSNWRASNMFGRYAAAAAWSLSFRIPEAAKGSYLAIPIGGKHGKEGAYAAVRVDGRPTGCPDRAVSFASNVWEYQNYEAESGYTYFIPATPDMVGTPLDAVVLSSASAELKPEVWITAYPTPFEMKELVLL
jgi:hypothetical protein